MNKARPLFESGKRIAIKKEGAEKITMGNAAGQTMETDPTEAQIEAENYKKAHVTIDGLDISIENPVKSTRSGTDGDGNEWTQDMWDDYGYVRGSVGHDSDHVDCFLNPELDDEPGSVYVVNQLNADDSFDEHKCMVGYASKASARASYLQNYEDGWDRDGDIVEMSWDRFKEWVMSDLPKKGKCTKASIKKIAKIILDIEKGDTLLVGRFKNKPVKVESIGTDSNGQPTINGRKLLALRIAKLMPKKAKPATASAAAKKLRRGKNTAKAAGRLRKKAEFPMKKAVGQTSTEAIHQAALPHLKKYYAPSMLEKLKARLKKVTEKAVPHVNKATALITGLIPKQAEYDASNEWIGVDLDGTLAKYYEWKGRAHIGTPIKPMVKKVKGWLEEGKKVKILTARASGDNGKARYHIRKWCTEHIGQELPITCVKDRYCTALYDDKAKGVTKNRGKVKTISKQAESLEAFNRAVNLVEHAVSLPTEAGGLSSRNENR